MIIVVALCMQNEKNTTKYGFSTTVIFKWIIRTLTKTLKCHFGKGENGGLDDSKCPYSEK